MGLIICEKCLDTSLVYCIISCWLMVGNFMSVML